jgi:outer membrane protein, heavy metal efflux system
MNQAMKGILVAVLTLGVACIQVDPNPDFEQARRLVEQSTGRSEVFDPAAPAMSEGELEALLADGLCLEEALRLALVGNRELQADFQDIGVAHADWVQARLLSNPSLDLLFRTPTDGGRSLFDGIIGVQLLELWRIPVRARSARHDLEATVLRIARRGGETLAAARGAYYGAVAAEDLRRVAEENVELAARSFEAVRDLHQAGAADAFDENLARGPQLLAQLALRTARTDAARAKRDLAKALSLGRSVDGLVLSDPLPGGIELELDPEDLVHRALGARLDLRSIEAAILALDARVRVEERRAWGELAAGPSVERPARTGGRLVGPSLSLSLPVFDLNQAQVARSAFKLERMVKQHESARIAVAQDVRSSVDRVLTAARSLDFYRSELLPQAELSLDLARQSYSAGRATLLALIEVQRQVLEARRGHVALRLEAALSASELERVLGVPLR